MALTKPLAHYAHIKQTGSLVFVAGQGARDPVTGQYIGSQGNEAGELTSWDPAAQARQVLANVEGALKSVGLDRRDIVDATVFLIDMKDFPAMNDAWNEFFREVEPPTRTTVCVKRLPGLNSVEIKAIAGLRHGNK